jgi:pyrroline-5-carboxylate reductase
MQLSQHVSFIGSGNMASALIRGLISAGRCRPDQIVASDIRAEALAALAASHGVRTTVDNGQAASEGDVIVLSTKPQVLPGVLLQLAPHVSPEAIVISIAAGVPTSVIEARLPKGTRVIRAMPNTPALVGAGATAIAAGSTSSDADMNVAGAIFESVGIVERVSEPLLDAVTGLSGSGPAYVFLLVEALARAGTELGLPPVSAARLAAQTVFGAGQLLHQSGEPPHELRRKVTSPAGTTAAGIERLERLDFPGIVANAVRRAAERAAELGAEAARSAS